MWRIVSRPGIPSWSSRSKQRDRHLRRGAVAEGVRNAEPKGAAVRDAGRIDRCKQQRGALEVVARGQLELAVQIAPVGRQGGDGFGPRVREPQARCVHARRSLARLEQPDRAADPLVVDLPQQLRQLVGPDSAAGATDRHAQLVAGNPGPGRTEQSGRT